MMCANNREAGGLCQPMACSSLRVVWRQALQTLGGLNPQLLPVVESGQLVMRSLPEIIGLFNETAHSCTLLADVLRGAPIEALHHELRTAWIKGNGVALVRKGWRHV